MFGLFKKVQEGVQATKNRFSSVIKSIFSRKSLDSGLEADIEETLYSADCGVETTQEILKLIREAYKKDSQLKQEDFLRICSQVLNDALRHSDPVLSLQEQKPTVIALIGANGSGKTTTAAKLAAYFSSQGKSVMVGACDTFRAAANEQIKKWSEDLHFDLVESHQGADSASVAFDACTAAIRRKKEVLILDTAGRLHNKVGLVAELQKLKRVVGKVDSEFPQHTWLVVDASLGMNSIAAAKKYHEEIGLTGIVITKLDGTSKGGVIFGIYRQLGLPIYFVGLGEKFSDLVPFNAEEYVEAFLGKVK